ncbi:MAG: hypothetical protein HOL01_07895 [Planctomycetaceae bacterium]|jgi:hypothetical protein|nr:hypothetical protein [Planctomycetaceae bacterium]MBT6486586.1 hypothetical protein [Planctomycetaceae bacterium]MBT6494460.1 hypothetical protein [Planctomycetaceae bacterium]
MEAVIAELHALADVVMEGKLGGLLFPAFVKHFRQTNGREPADAVWDVVRQVEAGPENLRPADVRRLLLKKVDELSGI